MPLAPDDDMIVDIYAQQPPGFGDAVGDLDVGARGLGAAGGVVVDDDQRHGADVERPADDLARVDGGIAPAVCILAVEEIAPGQAVSPLSPVEGPPDRVLPAVSAARKSVTSWCGAELSRGPRRTGSIRRLTWKFPPPKGAAPSAGNRRLKPLLP